MPDEIEASTIRAVSRRFVPLLLSAYVVSYLDRSNVGFAALTANADLGLTPTLYGWGAGLFLVGDFLFEFPSNLALERVGARLWIMRIMITLRPHPNVAGTMPNDGDLVDLLHEAVPDAAARRAILVDNPTRLDWPHTA